MALFFNRNKFKKPVSARSDPAYITPHGLLVLLRKQVMMTGSYLRFRLT